MCTSFYKDEKLVKLISFLELHPCTNRQKPPKLHILILWKHDSDNCPAKLNIHGDTYPIKGSHICRIILTESNQVFANEIPPDQFINEYICSKSSELQFYPHQIYNRLLSELRTTYRNLPYNVLSKKSTYAKV
ncbi:hypothetical protein HZS_5926 [Henneguya salminicola]|nr:hypothetical protein HZS_5926 [Henneguya salminicola]